MPPTPRKRSTRAASGSKRRPRKATGRPVGRPTVLTDELRETVKQLLASGASLEAAALSAGVSRRTFSRWNAIAREAEEKLDRDEPLTEREVECLEFLNTAEEARATLKVRLLASLQKGAQSDWRAALAMLERLWPEEFAPKSRGATARPGTGRPVGSASAPDRSSRPGVLYAVEGGKS